MHYLVFGSTRRALVGGSKYLDWGNPPIGVYNAETPEEACQAAAADSNNMGTFFAVAGYPWGVEMMQTGATELGRTPSPMDRLNQHLDQINELERLRQKVEQLQAGSGDNE